MELTPGPEPFALEDVRALALHAAWTTPESEYNRPYKIEVIRRLSGLDKPKMADLVETVTTPMADSCDKGDTE